jgi:maleate cis-trans isomerase
MGINYRGTVGIVNPTRGASWLDEFRELLPEGIGIIPSFLNIREQTESEFRGVLDETAARVSELAGLQPDLIHPIGAPVFMVHGFAGEQRIIAGWEDEHGIPMFTSGQSHVSALRALGIKRFVGLSPLSPHINEIATRYFRDAGFDVLALDAVARPQGNSNLIPWEEVYRRTKRLFLEHDGADGIYFISSGWHILQAVLKLEQDLGVPVVHPVTARVWEIQRRLRVREPVLGGSRLLEELPPAVAS